MKLFSPWPARCLPPLSFPDQAPATETAWKSHASQGSSHVPAEPPCSCGTVVTETSNQPPHFICLSTFQPTTAPELPWTQRIVEASTSTKFPHSALPWRHLIPSAAYIQPTAAVRICIRRVGAYPRKKENRRQIQMALGRRQHGRSRTQATTGTGSRCCMKVPHGRLSRDPRPTIAATEKSRLRAYHCQIRRQNKHHEPAQSPCRRRNRDVCRILLLQGCRVRRSSRRQVWVRRREMIWLCRIMKRRDKRTDVGRLYPW